MDKHCKWFHLKPSNSFLQLLSNPSFANSHPALPYHMKATNWGWSLAYASSETHSWTATHATPHGSITHPKESIICPLRTCIHRCSWLASVIVTDSGERIISSFPPRDYSQFCSLGGRSIIRNQTHNLTITTWQITNFLLPTQELLQSVF